MSDNLAEHGEQFVAAHAVGDLDTIAFVLTMVTIDQLVMWLGSVLAGERRQHERDLEKSRQMLIELRAATDPSAAIDEAVAQAVAQTTKRVRLIERAAADEVRRENADLVAENQQLRERMRVLMPINPAGMDVGRAFDIALISDERRNG